MADPYLRTGRQSSANTDVLPRLDIDDAIVILPVDDVPLQRYAPSLPTQSIEVQWLEEVLTPQVVDIASVSGTTSPWTVTLKTAADTTKQAVHVRLGDIFRLKGSTYDRQFVVTGTIDAAANTAVVSSFAGTTNSQDPVADDVWELIGQLPSEGGDPLEPRSVALTSNYNWTQIGQEKVSVTRTQQRRAMYGIADPRGHEVSKKFRELAIRFERAMVSGYRYQSTDQTQRFMGGVLFYISTNTQSGVAASAKTLVNGLVRKTYENGGTPDTLMVAPGVKAAISTNYDATLRRGMVSDKAVGFVVDRVTTDFGDVDIVANRHFPATKGILFQREFIKRRPFDPYFYETLAKTGDSENGEIVGEQSLEVKNELAMGVLTITDAS